MQLFFHMTHRRINAMSRSVVDLGGEHLDFRVELGSLMIDRFAVSFQSCIGCTGFSSGRRRVLLATSRASSGGRRLSALSADSGPWRIVSANARSGLHVWLRPLLLTAPSPCFDAVAWMADSARSALTWAFIIHRPGGRPRRTEVRALHCVVGELSRSEGHTCALGQPEVSIVISVS